MRDEPLTQFTNVQISSKLLELIILKQRSVRSKTREKIHNQFFRCPPLTIAPSVMLPSQYTDLEHRLQKIISDLSGKRMIINQGKLHHYTDIRNLQNIIRTG